MTGADEHGQQNKTKNALHFSKAERCCFTALLVLLKKVAGWKAVRVLAAPMQVNGRINEGLEQPEMVYFFFQPLNNKYKQTTRRVVHAPGTTTATTPVRVCIIEGARGKESPLSLDSILEK